MKLVLRNEDLVSWICPDNWQKKELELASTAYKKKSRPDLGFLLKRDKINL